MIQTISNADQSSATLPPAELCVLANDRLEAVFAPERGGKAIALLNKETMTQWVLPPLRPYAQARADAGFDAWDGGGFDECLPTVAATATAADHGEVWRNAWLASQSAGTLTMRTTACGGALSLERTARLEDASLVLGYAVVNSGVAEQSLLYSAHPLLHVREGDRIVLPAEVNSVRVEGSLGERLGSHGARVAWPLHESEDLSRVGPPDGKQADKLFAGPFKTGLCSVLRPSTGEGIELSFDAMVLPYLGVWICRAAWPGTGDAKQYAVALEPTSAPCDSLAEAEQEGFAWRLQPGESRAWTLRFRVIAATRRPGA